MEYQKIQKGRGVVYVVENQLYKETGRRDGVTYVMCCFETCFATGKLHRGEFHGIVSVKTSRKVKIMSA
jgi:hypothetical protein